MKLKEMSLKHYKIVWRNMQFISLRSNGQKLQVFLIQRKQQQRK